MNCGDVKRRAHTQNPKNETEIQSGRERNPNPNHRDPKETFGSKVLLNNGSIFTGKKAHTVL